MAKTIDKMSGAADTVKPYVERALSDEELRENLKTAFAAARGVYEELVGGRRVTSAAARVATDKEIQENLRKAVDELRAAARRVQGKEERAGRSTGLLVAAIALGILFNPVTGPETRRFLKERLFGGGEFGYEASSNGG